MDQGSNVTTNNPVKGGFWKDTNDMITQQQIQFLPHYILVQYGALSNFYARLYGTLNSWNFSSVLSTFRLNETKRGIKIRRLFKFPKPVS